MAMSVKESEVMHSANGDMLDYVSHSIPRGLFRGISRYHVVSGRLTEWYHACCHGKPWQEEARHDVPRSLDSNHHLPARLA